MWNLYVISVLILYAPSRQQWAGVPLNPMHEQLCVLVDIFTCTRYKWLVVLTNGYAVVGDEGNMQEADTNAIVRTRGHEPTFEPTGKVLILQNLMHEIKF